MSKWAVRTAAGTVLSIVASAPVDRAFAQAADDFAFQISFATDLRKSSAQIQLSNSGAISTIATPQNGTVCANIYAFADGPMVACCSCLVAPNTLARLSVKADVLENLHPAPSAVVLAVITSRTPGGSCNASTVDHAGNELERGLLAWQNAGPFRPASHSAVELDNINSQCAALHPSPHACPACQLP
jgi:hypothetical protein